MGFDKVVVSEFIALSNTYYAHEGVYDESHTSIPLPPRKCPFCGVSPIIGSYVDHSLIQFRCDRALCGRQWWLTMNYLVVVGFSYLVVTEAKGARS